VKGGTSEGGGSGPGQNASTDEEAFSLLAASATCAPEKGDYLVEFEWLVDDPRMRNRPLNVELSGSEQFAGKGHRLGNSGTKAQAQLKLAQGTVYNWRIRGNMGKGKGGERISETGTVFTPVCPPYDESVE